MSLDNNTNVLENFLLVVYNCFMDIKIYQDKNGNCEDSLKARLADSAYAKEFLLKIIATV